MEENNNLKQSYEELKIAYKTLIYKFLVLNNSYRLLRIDYEEIFKLQDNFFEEINEIKNYK